MRIDPRAWFLEHWPIKVVALLLSLVLWLVIAAKRNATQLRQVEVSLQLPHGRTLARPLPRVSALVVGRASGLLELYRAPLKIHKVVPDTVIASEHVIALSPADVVVPPDAKVTVQELQPRELVVALDQVVRRRVSVRPRVVVRPDSGFLIVGGVLVIPSEVEIAGPRAVVDATDSLVTEPVEILGARESIRRLVPLDTTATWTLRVTPPEVQIIADVAPLAERLFPDVPVTVTDPRWTSDPPVVTVSARGAATRILALAADSFSVAVSPADGATAGDSARVTPLAPSGVSIRATPGTVVLRRRGRGG